MGAWPHRVVRLRVLAVVICLLCVSCSGPGLVLPDRTDPEVQAEEYRLALILEDSDVWAQGLCDVRLIRHEGSTSWAWAYCTDGWSGVSAPVRVDGDVVSMPRDGDLYAEDIAKLFPDDLADAIFSNDPTLQPNRETGEPSDDHGLAMLDLEPLERVRAECIVTQLDRDPEWTEDFTVTGVNGSRIIIEPQTWRASLNGPASVALFDGQIDVRDSKGSLYSAPTRCTAGPVSE